MFRGLTRSEKFAIVLNGVLAAVGGTVLSSVTLEQQKRDIRRQVRAQVREEYNSTMQEGAPNNYTKK